MAGGVEGSLSSVLREAVASGRFEALGELLAPDAVLDTSSETGRRAIQGRGAIVAHLQRPGPGDVLLGDRIYCSYFVFIGAFAPYFSLYLQSIGQAAWQIGLLLSLMQFMRIVAPHLWA